MMGNKGVYDKYEIQLTENIAKPNYVFSVGKCGSSPKGDIIAIKAKPKSGKTMLAILFSAVILGADSKEVKSANPQDSKVLYFDTEQNKANVQALMGKIHTILGWDMLNCDRLHVYYMREMEMTERWQYIENKTAHHKPTAIFIDGVADLIADFNDIGSSQEIIQKMMTLSSSYDCAVFFILHVNKTDSNMKGHLGTLATQKCSDVFCVDKQKDGSFKVTETDCRNRPVDSFTFRVSEDGIPFLIG